MGGLGLAAPTRAGRRIERRRRDRKGRRRGIDGEMRPVDPAELLDARMDMHEGHLRRRNVDQACSPATGISLEPPADQHDEIGRLDPRHQLGIGADAEIAGIIGVQRMEQVAAAEGGRDRHREFLGKTRDGGASRLAPPAAAEQEDRPLGLGEERGERVHLGAARRGLDRPDRAARRRPRPVRSACPRAARPRPGRDGHWPPCGRRATRFPAPAPDRRSRSPIWSWCRTRRGNRAPGTPRARACGAPPGRRT